jgi:hypothetical protein
MPAHIGQRGSIEMAHRRTRTHGASDGLVSHLLACRWVATCALLCLTHRPTGSSPAVLTEDRRLFAPENVGWTGSGLLGRQDVRLCATGPAEWATVSTTQRHPCKLVHHWQDSSGGVVLRLRGAGHGMGGQSRGKGAIVAMQRRKGKGGMLMTAGGRIMHAGKGKDDVMEWVRRKRRKQVLRNQRKHRQEIQETKQFAKQKGILAAIIISSVLDDADTRADDLRVHQALKDYESASRINKTAAVADLERKLWIPPRVRDPEGLADPLIPLGMDFVDTPEVRAERRRLRLKQGAVPGRGAFTDVLYPPPPDSMDERVKGTWDSDSSDENSAPDWDACTYIEPSIYACPEGDRENPHREGAEWGKQVLEAMGYNIKAQTSLDMDKALSLDPHEEALECLEDRDTLTRQLQHLYQKLRMRWAVKFPRYRQFLLREIQRLEVLIPVSRPTDVPPHEWLAPADCERILRHGGRVRNPLPPHPLCQRTHAPTRRRR